MTDAVAELEPELALPTPLPPELAAKPAEPPPVVTKTLEGVHVYLMPDYAVIDMLDGSTRRVSLEDFASKMVDLLEESKAKEPTSSLLLPPNVYRIEESIKRLTLGLYYPATKQSVDFNGTRRMSVVPNIIITIKFDKVKNPLKNVMDFKYVEAQYFCTNLSFAEFDKSLVTAPSRLKKITALPFTNVYDGGLLCFGQNQAISTLPAGDLRGASWIHDVLWASTFNTDLGLRALHEDSAYKRNLTAWYDHLAKLAETNSPFPYKELGI